QEISELQETYIKLRHVDACDSIKKQTEGEISRASILIKLYNQLDSISREKSDIELNVKLIDNLDNIEDKYIECESSLSRYNQLNINHTSYSATTEGILKGSMFIQRIDSFLSIFDDAQIASELTMRIEKLIKLK